MRLAHVDQMHPITAPDKAGQLLGLDLPLAGEPTLLSVMAGDPTERLVVDELSHLWLIGANAAIWILLQAHDLEAHGKGVVEQQLPDQRFPNLQDELQRLTRLKRTDHSGEDTEDSAFGARRDKAGRRRFWEQATVAWSAAGPEDAALPLEAEDRAVDVGLPGEDAKVVDQVPCGKIVGAIDNQVIRRSDGAGVFRGERLVVRIDLDPGIDVEHAVPCREDFTLSKARRAVDGLALQIGEVDDI